MHKTPIDLRRLLPLVLLTLTLLTPRLVSAADSAQTAGPEQPFPSEQPADIPRADATPAFGYVYTVVAGDDIWQIATAHGLDMESLAAENNLEAPYWLQPGDKLWVPAEPAPVHSPAPPAELQPSESAAIYVVQNGDNLWQIAVAYGFQEQDLAAANNLQPPYLIHPGDRLQIPGQPAQPEVNQAVGQKEQAAPAAAEETQAASPEQASDSATANELSSNSADSAGLSPDAALIFNSMNEKRAAFGLAPLSWSDQLASAAQAHAEDLSWRGWGGHVGSDGAHLRTRYERVGYWATYASENWANAHDAQHAFDMWWFEPDWGPHRLNILGPAYSEIGIGIVKGGWGYYYVADFGSR
ncbi:MAG: LysM peptidoglycan-binding domain-containing protein [Caldilineae bacterium]|nr:LysM peptidoglycan-binding domain-containing protein [Anaerolineae bacterium]MCB0255266.1 LysM peptidoglycan-binding domain-containing protein [Anaerolineae bacterium]MCB9153443.1 LysM peptidoglycan-binding domain-containing protein [Caldilineae bacterium]